MLQLDLPKLGSATVLTGNPEDENTFEHPDRIKPQAAEIQGEGRNWEIVCSPYSLTVATLQASL